MSTKQGLEQSGTLRTGETPGRAVPTDGQIPAVDEVDRLVRGLHGGLDRLLAADMSTVDDRGAVVLALLRAQARLEAATLSALAAFDASEGAVQRGDGTTRVWLARTTTMSPSQAAGMVRTARLLHTHLTATKVALARGEIAARHSAAVVSAVSRVGLVHAEQAEPVLLDLARRADPQAVRAAGRYLHEVLDPVGAERASCAEVDRRGVSFSISDGRGYLDGVLDPESTETLQSALMALMAPGPHDQRTVTQRRADALVDLARRALDSGQLPGVDGTAQRPHVAFVVDAETLLLGLDATTAPDRGHGTASGGGSVVATLPWTGTPLGRNAVRRLTCDARLTPVLAKLLDTGSNRGRTGVWLPLNVGRAARTVTPAQATALRVRDGGCIIPGCARGHAYTHAHHVRHWADGGPTDLNNLVLLCGHHHRALHHGHWTITIGSNQSAAFEVTDRHGRTRAAQHAGNRAPPAGLGEHAPASPRGA